MKWRPSPPNLLETFEEVAPGPPVVRRKMFGYPAAFVNGNMFLGLFQDQMIVRLPEQLREDLIREGGALFEPMPGRPMREYVVVPASVLGNPKALSSWVAEALAYGRRLPPKASKKKKTGGKNTPRRRAARKGAPHRRP
jgi:TfoX/Sxy family transcriptional regulator of competence genes